MFVGDITESQLLKEKEEFAFQGVGIGKTISANKQESIKAYFDNYLGYPINIVSAEEINIDIYSSEIKEMKSFPYIGSVKFFNDILVVKLSDIN